MPTNWNAVMPTNWNAVMPTINIIKQYKEHSHIYTGTNPKHFFIGHDTIVTNNLDNVFV